MTVVPSAVASSQARSIVLGPTHVAQATTCSPCLASSSCAIATCSAVAQSGWRCAPQRSTASNPSVAHVAEQLVEPLAIRLEGPERVVRGAVAVGPAVHRPSRLAGDVVGGDEGDGAHSGILHGSSLSCLIRHPEYTRARLRQTSERLQALIYPETRAPDELLVAGPVERITREDAQELDYRPARLGERFGPLWSTHWFRGAATVPDEWGDGRVDLVWDSASEATLWLEGFPAQGLNRHHRDAVLVERAAGGERVEFEVELACNDLFGEQHAPYELHLCELGRFDADAWRLALDFEILRALADEDGLDEAWAGELLSELNRFCNVWPEPEGAEILAALYERRNATTAHELVAVGHAHLDTAWLWPLAETYRKAIRTFTTQARYLRQYPDYRFACSQAQQYAWIEETRPELWAEIKALVDAGGWVPVGGTWIEPDCNIPSGESLLRQFLHGQRYFEQRFGRRCTEFWNPDVFGYNGQLPQIMREGGVVRFLTQKLSWNRFNQPEHHTFVWQGIDGSEVLGALPARRHLHERRHGRGATEERTGLQGSRALAARRCSSTATATGAAGRRAR